MGILYQTESFLTACISSVHEPDKPWSSQQPSCTNSRKELKRCLSPNRFNNTKQFWAQAGASIRLTVWKWSGESRYPGAFPPVLENFFSPFLLVWLTAPGSPRMDYTLIKYEQLMRQEWTMKAAGNRTCIIMLRFSDFSGAPRAREARAWAEPHC